MADPGVSDAEKEKLLAEIGVEPSSVSVPKQAPSSPRIPAPPPPAAAVPLPAPAPAAARPEPAWWRHRHAAAGVGMALAGSAWTMVAVGFGDPFAGGLAALALGGAAAALLRPVPIRKKS